MAEPYTHVGGVLTYVAGPLDFAAGVVNGWDQANDNNSGKTWVGKIGMNFGEKLSGTLSGYHGPEQNPGTAVNGITPQNSGNNRDSLDLTVPTKLIPKVDLFLQGNIGTEKNAVANPNGTAAVDDRASWSGAGIQPVVHLTDKLSLGARLEYFEDNNGARTGFRNNSMTNFTVTPGYKINDNLLVRAEYRYDTSNKKVWVDDENKAKDSASTGTVQFVVSF
jgi:hypothetical protein